MLGLAQSGIAKKTVYSMLFTEKNNLKFKEDIDFIFSIL